MPTGPWLSAVYYPRACKRYYGLMRQSGELRPAWACSACSGRSLPLRAVRLTFPSLLCHTVHTCRDLYPVGWPGSFDGSSPGPKSLHRSYHGSAVPRHPSHWFQRGKHFRGGSHFLMLRPARWLERLTSLRRSLCPDRSARLRQSLPPLGSPPAGVCYHYSAQPSIAEAGLAPASMSKVEGCT